MEYTLLKEIPNIDCEVGETLTLEADGFVRYRKYTSEDSWTSDFGFNPVETELLLNASYLEVNN